MAKQSSLDEQKILQEMFKITNLPPVTVPPGPTLLDRWAQTSDAQMGRPPRPKPLLEFGVLGECPKCKYTCRDPFARKYAKSEYQSATYKEWLELTCRQCGYVIKMKCADADLLETVKVLEKKVKPKLEAEDPFWGTPGRKG